MTDFPADFLWGSSTAAHQVEGGNTNNDWWQWEHTPGSTAVESSGDGVNHWHRFDTDFAPLSVLRQNAHRFSMEWSRIEPAEGEFSRAALDHYRAAFVAGASRWDRSARAVAGRAWAIATVIAVEARGSMHRSWAAELERLHPGSARLFAPSETKAARTQLGSGRFNTDDRDCAALTLGGVLSLRGGYLVGLTSAIPPSGQFR